MLFEAFPKVARHSRVPFPGLFAFEYVGIDHIENLCPREHSLTGRILKIYAHKRALSNFIGYPTPYKKAGDSPHLYSGGVKEENEKCHEEYANVFT